MIANAMVAIHGRLKGSGDSCIGGSLGGDAQNYIFPGILA